MAGFIEKTAFHGFSVETSRHLLDFLSRTIGRSMNFFADVIHCDKRV